jgi:ABC-2 type transport system ATP-binding protein
MPSSILTIDSLRVDFADVVAVRDVSLALDPGDVCGLIGPNGAGKTTTLRAVVGLELTTHGEVRIAGYDLRRNPTEFKRLVGLMSDTCPVYDQLTVVEFLDHFARAYRVADRAARVAECLAFTSLTEKRDAPCGTLSRGIKQRLVLAKTLLPDPSVLLLDEPASGLDPLARVELRNLLQKLRSLDKAVLISSHILGELAGFCNKVAIMERGKLVSSGTIAELSRHVGKQRMLVKWRQEQTGALEVLRGFSCVKNITAAPDGATFDLEGNADANETLLKELIQQGVRVTQWRSLGDDLEYIFFQSGAKEVM